MYGLFGKITAQSGQRDTLLGYLLQAAHDMRELDGCYLYVVSSAPDDPDGIWVYEAWKSQNDHQASLSLEATQALIAKARSLTAGMSNRVEHTPLGGKGLPDSADR
jgi:quinol monooxygenase YgiN